MNEGEFLMGVWTQQISDEITWETKRAVPIPDHPGFFWIYAQKTEAEQKKVNLNDFPVHDPFLPTEIRTT